MWRERTCKDDKTRCTTVYNGLLKPLSDQKLFSFLSFFIVSDKQELRKNPQIKMNSLKKQKHWYIIITWSVKAFKCRDRSLSLLVFWKTIFLWRIRLTWFQETLHSCSTLFQQNLWFYVFFNINANHFQTCK